jgi:hypothetical protein
VQVLAGLECITRSVEGPAHLSANEPGSLLSDRAVLTLSGIACNEVKHTVTCQLC